MHKKYTNKQILHIKNAFKLVSILLIVLIAFSGCIKSIPGSKEASGDALDMSALLSTASPDDTGAPADTSIEDTEISNATDAPCGDLPEGIDDSNLNTAVAGDDKNSESTENKNIEDSSGKSVYSPTAKPDDNANTNAQRQTTKNKVSISIKGNKGKIILETASVDIKDGDTAFSVLNDVCEKNGIEIDYSGSGATAYVKGIGDDYEFDNGSESGWIFAVNGYTPGVGSGAYKVKNGDEIQWGYTLNSGKDLGFLKG